nr:MAG TPA: hypothetical protein [Caudoviricetes sp.]
MPTPISGAIGTQRQFTPQPDAGYVGRYAGVSPVNISASTNRNDQLAQNLSQLTAALSSYRVSHEGYLNDTGSIDAERMVRGESEESIRKLNAIDAAQQEGFADALSNPYFKAHAERLRGGFLSTVMKNAYDEKYAMTPARTAQEEANRYNQFARDWQKTNLSGDAAPVNMTAFASGFNENQLVNMGNLMATWEKKNYENEVKTVLSAAESKLEDIILNAPDLLKTNGVATDKAQEAVNDVRLMGLPLEFKRKLVLDFAEKFIKLGYIDGTRLSQMMDRITIQTSFDGTEMKASDLLPMATLKGMADDYHAQFHTQERYDWEQNHIKNGTLTEARAEAMSMEYTNPAEARYRNSRLPAIESGIEQKKREEERALRARQKAAGRGGKRSGGTVTDTQAVSDIVSAWMRRDIMVYGRNISSYSIDKDALASVTTPLLQRFIAQGDFAQTMRLMDMPQMSSMRSTISSDLANTLSTILPSDDGGVNIGSNESVRALVGMIIENPNAIANTFGGDLAREAYTLKTLSIAYGGGDTGYDEALRLYALSNQTKRQSPDVHSANANTAERNMWGFTIDNVPHARGGKDWADFGQDCNAFVADDIRRLWTTFLDAGMSPWQAQTSVNDCVRDNYETYHFGVFPRSVYANLGTGDDRGFFRQAMDSFIYSTCEGGSTRDYEETTIGYNPITRIFTFSCDSMGRTRQVTLKQLCTAAQELADGNSADTSISASTWSVDDINDQRFAPNTEPDYSDSGVLYGIGYGTD